MSAPDTDNSSLQAALGLITMNWAILEFSLAMILAELIETDHATTVIVSAALDYRHRRDLINSLAAIKLCDDKDTFRDLAAYMGHVKGMAKERNEAVHSMWTTDPHTNKIMKINIRNQGSMDMAFKPTAPGHLKSIADKIGSLANQGTALAIRVREAVKTWHERHPLPLPPHLEQEARRQEANPDKP
ncbi:hypothetical protein [Methylosinus sp. Ce-a6]|uniref:hypothetical protein n=1 Tax=Methylosinus sp. Ce-a6 TaxID=2172005 RepID=UPI00135C2B01|nr:hypothetical protein [Methylosinus sp. Ce-a6]